MRPTDGLQEPAGVRLLVERLRARGVVAGEVSVDVLPGGVSNHVYRVDSDLGPVVVKQPLAKLRVAATWYADIDRVIREGAALRLYGTLTPDNVPPVYDLDEEQHTLVMGRAPATWLDWRDELLAGRLADPAVSGALGRVVGTWHSATTGGTGVPDELRSQAGFEQLRIDPFHRAVAEKHPDLAEPLADIIDELLGSRICLVHGDVSPKNVLVGKGGPWVLDPEVTHFGDPVFDVAFLRCHLLLKSFHRPEIGAALAAGAAAFDASYAAAAPGLHAQVRDRLDRHVGALLLARVDGRSLATYLGLAEVNATRKLGRALVAGDAVLPW